MLHDSEEEDCAGSAVPRFREIEVRVLSSLSSDRYIHQEACGAESCDAVEHGANRGRLEGLLGIIARNSPTAPFQARNTLLRFIEPV